ncbi:hypothetical protein IFM89_018009 [Coptis chinensis]|uniref:NAC domain-containing protein n=1 Tax=Coptis chinensis TaxID=261450 RepID=A0A835LZY8_9MAGN|nr:hypothetical protein IFM89_018009 [Coptis chinensis]
MSLRDIEATLPPGFRFFPSDEELVCHYLYKKIANEKISDGTMVEVNLHICEPWQLPDVAKLGDNEWYFFNFRDRKYATGFRSNRTTISGFWKATGKDRLIYDPSTNAVVGMRKTLVFYFGRAPNGIKTGWVMHEFRLENLHMPPKEEWVLCRVFHKGKEELTSKKCLEYDIDDAIIGTSSPNYSSSPPVDKFMPAGSQQINSVPQCSYYHSNNPSTMLNLTALNPTFIELPREECDALSNENRSETGDEFLYDMILENGVLGMTGSSSFEEMTFEDDDRLMFL